MMVCMMCGKKIDDGYEKTSYIICYECSQKKKKKQEQKVRNKDG